MLIEVLKIELWNIMHKKIKKKTGSDIDKYVESNFKLKPLLQSKKD